MRTGDGRVVVGSGGADLWGDQCERDKNGFIVVIVARLCG